MNNQSKSSAGTVAASGSHGADAADAQFRTQDGTKDISMTNKGPVSAAQIVNLAAGSELFHTADREAYATVQVKDHRETHALEGGFFRDWLAELAYRRLGRPAQPQALDSAIGTLKAKALFDGAEKEVSVRLAQDGDAIYLDLGDAAWRAVRIDAEGWAVVTDCPIKFRRLQGMQALPDPTAGGTVAELRNFINLSDDDWVLLVAWLVGALRPTGPFPVLELQGEHGTAKSTTSEIIRALVDPNMCALRAAPQNERDLMIAAKNGWVIAYDNLSSIKLWLSNALCRVSTGGGFATRQLYTNQDETLINVQRPVLFNGIEELATRSDLLDRAVCLTLRPIHPSQRRVKEELLTEFELARPRILGALLTVVAAAIRNYPATELSELPRMADFAKWLVAAEPALPWPAGTFLRCYEANRTEAQHRALESNPVGLLVVQLVENEDWSGTASDLMTALREEAATDDEALGLPRRPSTLSGILTRLLPNFRAFGIDIERRREGRAGNRIIEITKDRVSSVSAAA